MTRTEHDRAARRRGELARDRGSRRVRLAVDAQRRLTARSASEERTKPDLAGPSDRRYAYLAQTHDWQGLVQLARDQGGSGPDPDAVHRDRRCLAVDGSRPVVSNRALPGRY
jgi:hypothetical protein